MENSLIFKLLEKSQEAFILAIEIYNKLTIKYRVEGFSFFYLQCLGTTFESLSNF
ncbi:MAG: DUF3644 domain-containing protein [Dialister pneumosintes]